MRDLAAATSARIRRVGGRIRDLPWRRVVLWCTVFVATAIAAASLLGNRIQAAANDAVFSRDLVLRAQRFGGTYYDNGIHPKGPLEEVAHDIANRIGGYDGHWYALAVLVALACLAVAAGAASTTAALGGGRAASVAVGAAVYIHFALSDAPYAGLLYSRNIVIALLAAAWGITVTDRLWTDRTRTTAALTVGAALGLAAQSVLPAVVAAVVIALTAAALLRDREPERAARRRPRLVLAGAAVGAFVSAPLWYAARGAGREFFASWWTYARFQQSGIGIGYAEALGRGWDVAWAHYRDRPLVALLVFAFAAFTAIGWPNFDRPTRTVHLGLLAWFAAGWLELVSGLRYSSHYFAVVAAPTAAMGAALAGHLAGAARREPRVRKTAVAWPLVAMVLAVYLSIGTTGRLQDAADLTGGFTGTAGIAAAERDALPDGRRSVRALLDLVSDDGDALLLYDDNQYLYDVYRRVPATRFAQRYFIVGSIYLGRTDERYILPGSEQWFADDLRESDPVAFLRTGKVDSPIVARGVRTRFSEVFTNSEGTVLLRRDVADELLGPAPTEPLRPASNGGGSGWTTAGTTARWESGTLEPDPLALAGGCSRITGTAVGLAGASPRVRFRLGTGETSTALVLDGTRAGVERPGGNSAESASIPGPATGTERFTVITGRRSAALVVRGRVVATTPVPRGASVSAEPLGTGVELRNLGAGAAPERGGC